MIEIQDNSETIEVEVFKLPVKEEVIEVKEPEPIKEIDPLDEITNQILKNINETNQES